jgi:hypothetical protein
MGKVGYKEHIVEKIVFFDFSFVRINEKSDLSKGEKADSKRENNMYQREIYTK